MTVFQNIFLVIVGTFGLVFAIVTIVESFKETRRKR